jgi:hypothetical protein
MEILVRPELPTAAVLRGLCMDHDRRRGQLCTVLNHPVALIYRGISVQINRATSNSPSPVNNEKQYFEQLKTV